MIRLLFSMRWRYFTKTLSYILFIYLFFKSFSRVSSRTANNCGGHYSYVEHTPYTEQ